MKLFLVCASIILATAAFTLIAGAANPPQDADIDHSVVSTLESQGVKQPAIVAHVDLTKSFDTTSPWTLVIARESGPLPAEISEIEDQGPLTVCFVKDLAPECSEKLYQEVSSEYRWYGTPFYLHDSRVVYAGHDNTQPMLLVKTCGARSGDGNCGIATALYTYDRHVDHFLKAFLNITGSNNNQDTRFVEAGPLRGDVIVAVPAQNAPYTYWIEVYRVGTSMRYDGILRYRGHTGYGDGNNLAVADSEMPEILRRLGLWQPGNALPVPPGMPDQCPHPVMRKREEWCK